MKKNNYKKYLKKLEEIFISLKPMIAVYILNFILDSGFNAYYYITWLDSPMHILGGFASAMSVIVYYKNYTNIKITTNNKYIDWLLLVSMVISISLSWEIYEFIMKQYWSSIVQATIFDTLKDMTFGGVGAFIYAYKYDIVLTKKKKSKKIKSKTAINKKTKKIKSKTSSKKNKITKK